MPRARRLPPAALGEFLRRLGPDPSATLRAAPRPAPARPRAGREHECLCGGPFRAQALAARRRAAPGGRRRLGGAQRRAPPAGAPVQHAPLATSTAPRNSCATGVLPAQLAMANPRFLRPCSGLGTSGASSCTTTRRHRPVPDGQMVGPAGPDGRPLRPRLLAAEPASSSARRFRRNSTGPAGGAARPVLPRLPVLAGGARPAPGLGRGAARRLPDARDPPTRPTLSTPTSRASSATRSSRGPTSRRGTARSSCGRWAA
jgi:hypothetical protein